MQYQVYRDTAKLYRWRLLTANNRTIADSGESYYNTDCLAAIRLVANSGSTTVIDLT